LMRTAEGREHTHRLLLLPPTHPAD
jgi:hypothetical protein